MYLRWIKEQNIELFFLKFKGEIRRCQNGCSELETNNTLKVLVKRTMTYFTSQSREQSSSFP